MFRSVSTENLYRFLILVPLLQLPLNFVTFCKKCSKYVCVCVHVCSVIAESPDGGGGGGGGGEGGGGGAVDMESIELTVMDDIHSPDSPQVNKRRTIAEDVNNSNSSDEEDSSGSDEDRYIHNLYNMLHSLSFLVHEHASIPFRNSRLLYHVHTFYDHRRVFKLSFCWVLSVVITESF